MNDLKRIEREIIRVSKQIVDWKNNGYDTPVMTYQEQLDEYVINMKNLVTQLGEIDD